MIETSFKNSQNQNFKHYNNRGALLLGYAPLLGIIRYALNCACVDLKQTWLHLQSSNNNNIKPF